MGGSDAVRRMYDVARDGMELDVLDALTERAGLIWVCHAGEEEGDMFSGCGWCNPEECGKCQQCGATRRKDEKEERCRQKQTSS